MVTNRHRLVPAVDTNTLEPKTAVATNLYRYILLPLAEHCQQGAMI